MKAAILVFLAAALSEAGALRVLVRDPSGASIANAEVRAGSRAARTDPSGQAFFDELPAGRVEVTIEAEGFARYSGRVRIREGTATLERTLTLAARRDEVEVGVDPREEASDPRGNFGSTALTPREIDQLPDDVDEMERMLREMAGPGAVLRVDGFRGGRLPHKSQIQSIRFRLTPYSAEEHDDGFMHVDIETKPGLGAWHGDGNFAFGDDALNARNAFARFREPQQSRRLDLNLMGPVIRNRTSTSFHFSRSDGYDARISTGVLPTGAFSQVIRLPNLATNAGARVQHSLTRTQVLRADYQYQQTERASAGFQDLPERVAEAGLKQHQLRLSLAGSIAERVVNETRLQAQWSDSANRSVTRAPSVIVQGAFQSGGANADSDRRTRAFEWTEQLSFQKGRHAFRAGLQADYLRHRGRDFTNGFGTTVYPSLAAYLAGEAALFSRRSADVTVGYSQVRLAAFWQDDIRLRKNLSLTLGLRQEGMSQVRDRNNSAPRIGFAWSPFQHGKTTLRGGAGLFYRWYEASLYEETLRLNGASQVDLVTSPSGVRLPGFLRSEERLKLPYVLRASIGVQQQLPGRLNLMLDYRHERGSQLLRTRNVNEPGSGYAYMLQLENGARSRMDGLVVGLSTMPAPDARGWRSRVFWNAMYLLSRSQDEVSNVLTPPADSRNARGDWGPSAMDVRHRFHSMLQFTAPGGWQVGTFFNASSAPPYNITTGFDANLDTFFNDRAPGVGRNTGRGEGQVNLSTRVAWSMGLGRRKEPGGGSPQMVRIRMDGSGSIPDLGIARGAVRPDAIVRMQWYVQATNVLNHTNPTGFLGVMTSPLFGRATAALPPRRLEVGVRFGF